MAGNRKPSFYSTIAANYTGGLGLLRAELCKPDLKAPVSVQETWTSIFAPKIIQSILGDNIEWVIHAQLNESLD